VHRAKLFGRCERKTGIAAFERLVAQVMSKEPYRSGRRVFLVADNGSSHRGPRAAARRLRAKWRNVILVHTPIHASWLNQIEVYFSIVERKLLTPSDFTNLAELQQRLMAFQKHYQQAANPFKWTFARRDLHALIAKLKSHNAFPRKHRPGNTSP
jgi:transposase